MKIWTKTYRTWKRNNWINLALTLELCWIIQIVHNNYLTNKLATYELVNFMLMTKQQENEINNQTKIVDAKKPMHKS